MRADPTPPAVAGRTDQTPELGVTLAPPAAEGGPGDEAPIGPESSLSPSRAADFMSCPLKYRFRVIDRLPETPSPAAVRGTLVHQVLEELFGLPAPERTIQRAMALVPQAWESLQHSAPEAIEMFSTAEEVGAWLESATPLLHTYFGLEDPTAFEPTERELRVQATLPSGLVLRGFVDRLDTDPVGRTRVVDYKTGRAPGPGFEQKALFQMRFYALVLWRSTGVIPTLLQLLYLGGGGSGDVVRYCPDEPDLVATERKIGALWEAITKARETGDWRPSPSRLCDWCDYQSLCPAFGGTPPPLPASVPTVPGLVGRRLVSAAGSAVEPVG